MTWQVYALCEPATAEIRYIGMSRSAIRRLVEHYDNPTSKKMGEWLTSVASPPIIKILATRDTRELAEAEERRLINSFAVGGRLLNKVPGDSRKFLPDVRAEFFGMGDRVKALRVERGWTAVDLAKVIGGSQPALSKLENDPSAGVNARTAVLLARALNTTVEYLVTGEGLP